MNQRNLLLAMEPKGLRTIEGDLEHIEFRLKDMMHDGHHEIEHVYFPTDGVVSMVNEPQPGEVVEIATIGREGMVGIPAILGGVSMPSKAFVQVPGEGYKLAKEPFVQAMQQDEQFRELLLRYALALLNQIAQSASCNRLHEVQERCARWLLQTHDRVSSDSFPLTHEFLAQMLGCHRPTVTVAAGILQKAGLIEYSRGMITIIDRKGLEAAACHCYKLITQEYDRLLNHRAPPQVK